MHLLWRFKICLPSLYNLIEFFPNDQNTLKLFSSIKRTNTYISSNKFVLNRLISMEVRFNTFPLSWWCDSILNNFLRIFLVARYRAVGIVTRVTRAPRSKRYLHLHFHPELAVYNCDDFMCILTTNNSYAYINIIQLYSMVDTQFSEAEYKCVCPALKASLSIPKNRY
jgi:hypothetical protein